ncbi:hypothetical protein E1B28_008228 [Marasmius oreades]|uniref:Uncharacterized protein n=1 Tax=Marasmius oreades TaxID=181124 RepID=A0A9P7RXW5_9AGAR|nr:uncharacterized protein E1B28_008228 [Marasmius oreades]KAG7091824.1 hypothetical protein E1B28_008228 [Marasmius oreades]
MLFNLADTHSDIQFTLRNPKTPGSGSIIKISLIQPKQTRLLDASWTVCNQTLIDYDALGTTPDIARLAQSDRASDSYAGI